MNKEDPKTPEGQRAAVVMWGLLAVAILVLLIFIWPHNDSKPVAPALPPTRPIVQEKAPVTTPTTPNIARTYEPTEPAEATTPAEPEASTEPAEPVIDESLLPQEAIAAQAALGQIYRINEALFAYAKGHDRKFPQGATANEVFRQLFIQGLVKDERLFVTSGLGESDLVPDGQINTSEEGFAAALAPGECSLSYLPGYSENGDATITPTIFFKTKAPSGMHYLIVANILSPTKINLSKTGKFPDDQNTDGREILSLQNGLDPKRILAPEAPPAR